MMHLPPHSPSFTASTLSSTRPSPPQLRPLPSPPPTRSDCKEMDIRTRFERFGRIVSVTIRVSSSSSSSSARTFAFVQFDTDDQASNAIQNMNGYKWDSSHTITVHVARTCSSSFRQRQHKSTTMAIEVKVQGLPPRLRNDA